MKSGLEVTQIQIWIFNKQKTKSGLEVTEIRVQIKKQKRNRAWRWPKLEFEFSKKAKSGLEVTQIRIHFFTKNEIGLGGDRTSNSNVQKQTKTKSGLEVTEIQIQI